MVSVAVFEQEVRVDRPRDYPGLEAAEPREPRVSRGDGPHGHGVEEVHVLGGRLLPSTRQHERGNIDDTNINIKEVTQIYKKQRHVGPSGQGNHANTRR